jgi:hypothetical protein
LQAWLLPVALTTTSGARVAQMLIDEFRNRRIIVPGVSLIERMTGEALLDAERYVADQLTQKLTDDQRGALDALLVRRTGTPLSVLAWARQSPGRSGHRAFAAILERLLILRDVGLDPHLAAGVHAKRIRQLNQEGTRLTAQHLRTLQPSRRHATLVATTLETTVTLTDDAILMFDRLIGQMFRSAQNNEDAALKRDRRTINAKIRVLAQLPRLTLPGRSSVCSHRSHGCIMRKVMGAKPLRVQTAY